MSLWDRLVGQPQVVEQLTKAAADAHRTQAKASAMTHAWLFTGPAGAGRSTAALLFAASLVCEAGGCGTCPQCLAVLSDKHTDVTRFIPEQLTITRDEAEELIATAQLMPSRSRFRILVIEDADRLSEVSGNMLLKSIEEPGNNCIWLLCTPSADDVLPTIRSRCRVLGLAAPNWRDVAALLEREGIDKVMAAFAARASQGHAGRARGLAKNEKSRLRRQEILSIPHKLRDLPACFAAAKDIVDLASEEANAEMDEQDAREREELLSAYGIQSAGNTKARAERSARGAIRDLETRQKSRRTRAIRDRLDQALVDLLSYFRDVLVLQIADGAVELINEELRDELLILAHSSDAAKTRRRMEAVEHARRRFASNAQPLIILETLTIELARA